MACRSGDRQKERCNLVAHQGSGRGVAGASVTLETGRRAGRALEGEEELTLGHVELEILYIRSQGA